MNVTHVKVYRPVEALRIIRLLIACEAAFDVQVEQGAGPTCFGITLTGDDGGHILTRVQNLREAWKGL